MCAAVVWPVLERAPESMRLSHPDRRNVEILGMIIGILLVLGVMLIIAASIL